MNELLVEISGILWNNLLYLLLGGGLFFAVFSRFLPFRYLSHGLSLLFGKWSEREAPGEVSHFRALCSALSGTVGMGNVAGVAVAITQGGPANATSILVYKVYNDGFVGLDLGGSAAQSVILMFLVVAMTIVQFRYIERRVEY